jgi:catechol 2,3-dioxygenase-like lactoylglutathione lyase family enzyme
MTKIRRIVPNVRTTDLRATGAFYAEIFGLERAMDLGFIETFVSPDDPTVQISFIREDPSGLDPQLTVEVADIDELHSCAQTHGAEIVYSLTDEPWGVRRFFVRDPNGTIVNVMSHSRQTGDSERRARTRSHR